MQADEKDHLMYVSSRLYNDGTDHFLKGSGDLLFVAAASSSLHRSERMEDVCQWQLDRLYFHSLYWNKYSNSEL